MSAGGMINDDDAACTHVRCKESYIGVDPWISLCNHSSVRSDIWIGLRLTVHHDCLSAWGKQPCGSLGSSPSLLASLISQGTVNIRTTSTLHMGGIYYCFVSTVIRITIDRVIMKDGKETRAVRTMSSVYNQQYRGVYCVFDGKKHCTMLQRCTIRGKSGRNAGDVALSIQSSEGILFTHDVTSSESSPPSPLVSANTRKHGQGAPACTAEGERNV